MSFSRARPLRSALGAVLCAAAFLTMGLAVATSPAAAAGAGPLVAVGPTACFQFPINTYQTIREGATGTIVQRAQCLLNRTMAPIAFLFFRVDGVFGDLIDQYTR